LRRRLWRFEVFFCEKKFSFARVNSSSLGLKKRPMVDESFRMRKPEGLLGREIRSKKLSCLELAIFSYTRLPLIMRSPVMQPRPFIKKS